MKGPRNVILAGYMQSWKYFDSYRDDIRSMFTFSGHVFNASLRAIERKLVNFLNNNRTVEKQTDAPLRMPTLVGIHVRRGDILDPGQAAHGHRPATEEYLLRAALHFQRVYAAVVFVVISNDNAYCKRLFTEPNFLIMDSGTPAEVDIAVLSLMDHIILSVGTYGKQQSIRLMTAINNTNLKITQQE